MDAQQRLNKILKEAKERVYKQRALKPTEYNDYQRKYMKKKRAQNTVEDKANNAIYMKQYRKNLKKEADKIKGEKEKSKALSTLSSAIKIRKAKQELKDLKEEKNKKDFIKLMVNDIIKVPTTANAKRGRPFRRPDEVKKVYNTRSKK